MFQKGQAVKCVQADNELPGCSPLLDQGKTYHVEAFDPPADCPAKWPNRPYWASNGGRIVIAENPTAEFFGRRFAAASGS